MKKWGRLKNPRSTEYFKLFRINISYIVNKKVKSDTPFLD